MAIRYPHCRQRAAGSLAALAVGEAGGEEAARPGARGGGAAERGERGDRPARVWVREYEDGRLLREDELGAEELEAAFGPLTHRSARHSRRRRRVRMSLSFSGIRQAIGAGGGLQGSHTPLLPPLPPPRRRCVGCMRKLCFWCFELFASMQWS